MWYKYRIQDLKNKTKRNLKEQKRKLIAFESLF